MAKYRVGIIGAAGSYSMHYGSALSGMPDVEFVGLAHLDRDPSYIKAALSLPWLSRYPKTVEAYQERFGGEIYERTEDLIEAGKPDAVCICTEEYLHQRHATIAIERGVHVFLPKPFAKTRQEGEEVFAAANARGLIAVGGLPHRFQAPCRAASEAIDQGAIGRPLSGHFAHTHHVTTGGWKSDPSMASGVVYENGFYVFDLMRMMMKSRALKVMGLGENMDHRGIPCIDTGKCLVQFEGGAMASVDLVMSMHHHFPPATVTYIVGDEGALTVEGSWFAREATLVIHTPDGVERRVVRGWDTFEREMIEWIALCRDGGDPAWWQEEALSTLDVITAYERAYQLDGVAPVGQRSALAEG